MKILNEKPPIYEEACKVFKVTERTVFCYGNVIYNPSGIQLSDDLIAHEETHCRQQNGDPRDWWDKYLVDEAFRLQQEVEAYGTQYKFICKHFKDKNQRFTALFRYAGQLASPLYGSMISHQEAQNLIKEYAI